MQDCISPCLFYYLLGVGIIYNIIQLILCLGCSCYHLLMLSAFCYLFLNIVYFLFKFTWQYSLLLFIHLWNFETMYHNSLRYEFRKVDVTIFWNDNQITTATNRHNLDSDVTIIEWNLQLSMIGGTYILCQQHFLNIAWHDVSLDCSD